MQKLHFVAMIYFFKVKIVNVNIWEMVRAIRKMHGTTSTDFDICHGMHHCKNCTPWPCPTFLRKKIWNVNISEMVRAITKLHEATFVDSDICRRMVSLRKLHSMTLTYSLKVQIWNSNISETVRASANFHGMTCRFWYLPLNDNIANIILHDLGLLFSGKKLETLISRKWRELAQ